MKKGNSATSMNVHISMSTGVIVTVSADVRSELEEKMSREVTALFC